MKLPESGMLEEGGGRPLELLLLSTGLTRDIKNSSIVEIVASGSTKTTFGEKSYLRG